MAWHHLNRSQSVVRCTTKLFIDGGSEKSESVGCAAWPDV